MTRFDEQRLVERVEVLAGDRPKARREAAVRVRDLAPLLELGQLQAAPAAGATPTAAEYAVLLRDTQRLHASLTAVAALLQRRLL